MATVTARGTANDNTAGTSLAILPATNCTAGATLVLWIALDNSGFGGSITSCTVADTKSNTWTSRIFGTQDPGNANEGITLRCFTTVQNGGTLTTTDTITATLGDNSKGCLTLDELSGNAMTYLNGATVAGATGTPTITSDVLAAGNIIFAAGAYEDTEFPGGYDGDTTNGSWSAGQGDSTGGASPDDTGVYIESQSKIVTGAGAQTYNPTNTGYDNVIGWVAFSEAGNTLRSRSMTGVGL